VRAGGSESSLLDAVRERLDDDLDTPGALALIDEAAKRGTDVTRAAAVLGVNLGRPVSVG
jgi:L-cysteine:1D-myo-inositol 2-amino-2-deoxy-alpha-D-glucopyranoside ligase